jgi:hypothetical protein
MQLLSPIYISELLNALSESLCSSALCPPSTVQQQLQRPWQVFYPCFSLYKESYDADLNMPGYEKNCLWRGDDLWFDRWEKVKYIQPEFVEQETPSAKFNAKSIQGI